MAGSCGKLEDMRERRRRDEWRMKRRAEELVRRWHGGRMFTKREVGRVASTHGRPCSCWLCAGSKEVPPRRERGFERDTFGQELPGGFEGRLRI